MHSLFVEFLSTLIYRASLSINFFMYLPISLLYCLLQCQHMLGIYFKIACARVVCRRQSQVSFLRSRSLFGTADPRLSSEAHKMRKGMECSFCVPRGKCGKVWSEARASNELRFQLLGTWPPPTHTPPHPYYHHQETGVISPKASVCGLWHTWTSLYSLGATLLRPIV